jgi:hypothetical protein
MSTSDDETIAVRPITPIEVLEEQFMQKSPSIEELLDLADGLPVEQRATLIQKLLGQNPGLSVVFGNNQLSGQIVVQINTADREAIGDVLDAISDRIRTEKGHTT